MAREGTRSMRIRRKAKAIRRRVRQFATPISKRIKRGGTKIAERQFARYGTPKAQWPMIASVMKYGRRVLGRTRVLGTQSALRLGKYASAGGLGYLAYRKLRSRKRKAA